MKSVSPATEFCKTARCPSSETLLLYRRRQVTFADRRIIEKHLRGCEFCGAELQLLKRHRYEIQESRAVEMPVHLRTLAESLLRRTQLMPSKPLIVYLGQLSH